MSNKAEAERAKKDLARIKAEAKTEELKKSATKTATTALNGLNSLLGGNKVNRLEKENAQLHREVNELGERIERLQSDMQKLKDNHARERNRAEEQHQQEVTNLKIILDKAYRWFPSFKRFLNMECECLQCGFNEVQTDQLLHGQCINYSGWLHSNEYKRNALANNVTAKVIRDENRNLFLHINETPIAPLGPLGRFAQQRMVQGAVWIGTRAAERNQEIKRTKAEWKFRANYYGTDFPSAHR